MLYAATDDFLTHFGLNSLADLPPLPEGAQVSIEALQPQGSEAPSAVMAEEPPPPALHSTA